ncbi:hypothetical protein HYDPIDRAFT_34051 [Hydnomerulius pinastri MD-312]|uniref:Protein kinase domain-containing protein n=1 Tax=Hydnomerulius pinastri MD-312 TaxID=994086 RepID=A0A0C9W6V9_9AGAM|nr:hypothetical protein HYDPIDRAFT_34051 [Hydnomerulius pinastri MD-312]
MPSLKTLCVSESQDSLYDDCDVGHSTIFTSYASSMRIDRKFKLLSRIGGGSQGDVFVARNILSGTEVAVKLQRLESGRALEREYLVYKSLTGGPGIAHLCWFGTDSGHHAMAMDRLGPSLEDILSQTGQKLVAEVVAHIGCQMVSCLEFIHTRDFIHRDIKPSTSGNV